MSDLLADYLSRFTRSQYDLLEEYIERALQGGKHGVKVIRGFDGITGIFVSPEVPYGEIHEYISS